MPLFRVRWASTDAEEGQWHADTLGFFRERYFINGEPTPYVRAEDPESLIWDLGFRSCVPCGGQEEGVHSLVLGDGNSWVEVRNRFLSFGWSVYPHRGEASVFAAIHTLEQFQIEVMPDPEQVQLIVQAGVHARAGGPPSAPGRGGASGISVSLIFGREHEPVLRDLRVLLEIRSGRRLTGRGSPPPGTSQITAGTGDPGVQDAEPHAGPATSPAPPEPPGGPAAAYEREDAAGPDAQDGRVPPAGKHSRPGARTLALAVDRVPDTPEWLSFAGPTTLELIASPSTDTDAPDPTITASPEGTGQAADW